MQLAQQAVLLQQLAAKQMEPAPTHGVKGSQQRTAIGAPPPYKGSQGKRLCDWVADDPLLAAAAVASGSGEPHS